MIGTSKEEQKKRQTEFKKVWDQFNLLNEKVHDLWILEKEDEDEEAAEEMDRILESPEYENLSRELSLGPTYDYLLADIQNPDYRDAFGHHPLDTDILREEYEKGIYGRQVEFKGLGSGVVECLAYDYGDYYYKFHPDYDPEKTVYISLIDKYNATD